MANLYELTDEYVNTFEQLATMFDDGVIDEDTFNNSMAGINADFEDKAINVAYYIKNISAELEALKKHKEEVADKCSRLASRIDRYKDYLRDSLKKADKKKVGNELISVSIGKPSLSVLISDESSLPDDVCVTVRKPDRAAIKKLLESNPVSGAELVAGKERLTIKV